MARYAAARSAGLLLAALMFASYARMWFASLMWIGAEFCPLDPPADGSPARRTRDGIRSLIAIRHRCWRLKPYGSRRLILEGCIENAPLRLAVDQIQTDSQLARLRQPDAGGGQRLLSLSILRTNHF